IDLAQENSVRWPIPQPMPLAGRECPPRRHYLRITASIESPTHAGLARRVDSLIRRAGLTVQNRASRGEAERVHLAFLVSPGDDARVAEVAASIGRLGRVQRVMTLGVVE